MKINTQVEAREEEIKMIIAEHFIRKLGFVEVEEERYGTTSTRMTQETRKLVINKIDKFLKDYKEEIIEKIVKRVAEKFDHATYKKQIINALLKEEKNDC